MRLALIPLLILVVAAISARAFVTYNGSVTETEFKSLLTPQPPSATRVLISAATQDGFGGAAIPNTIPKHGPLTHKLFAVVIGISKYKDPTINSLRFADRDAMAVKDALLVQTGKLYSDVHIVMLINENATRDAIISALSMLKDRPMQDDVSLLYLNGQSLLRQRNATGPETSEYYFVPYDTEFGNGNVEATGLSGSFIGGYASGAKGRRLIFVDTSKSGSAILADADLLSGPTYGATIFSATTGAQVAFEYPGLGHGAFTYALLEAFYGNKEVPQSANGSVTQVQLAAWLDKRVPELTNGTQRPTFIDTSGTSFEILIGSADSTTAPPVFSNPPTTRPKVTIVDVVSRGDGKTLLSYQIDAPKGAPITDLRVTIDGARFDTTKSIDTLVAGRLQTLELNVAAGNHQITLSAANAAGYGEEVSRGFVATSAQGKPPQGRLFALVIGIDSYQHEKEEKIEPLHFAVEDALEVSRILNLQKGKLYTDVQVTTLLGNRPGQEANTANIADGLLHLTREPADGDVSLLYISGHALTVASSAGGSKGSIYYFLPYDAVTNPDDLARHMISYTSMYQYAARAAGTRFIFLDTCRSGQADITDLVTELEKDRSTLVFYSSGPRQKSLEDSKWGHGAFTKAFLEGLHGNADNSRIPSPSHLVTDLGLADWLDKRVRQLTNDQQTPMIGGSHAHAAKAFAVVVPNTPTGRPN